MDKRTALLLKKLHTAPPDLAIGALAAWAAPRLSASREDAASIASLLAHIAWSAPASALEAALPELHRCAASAPDPATLWRHVARNLDHVEVHAELARLALPYGPAAARKHAQAALQSGATDPALVAAEVAGSILTGRFPRARALLHAHPGLEAHSVLEHLANSDAPLPMPACGCADHPAKGPAPPPSRWLKAFFEEGDSVYDATNYLCLSCHRFWQSWDEQMTSTSGWSRVEGTRYQNPSGWQLGMDNVSPGDDILADKMRFISWIRGLPESVASYGML